VDGLKEVDQAMETLQAQKALQEEPEGSKQLTVFRPPETEARKTEDYMALPSTDELAKKESPTVGQMFQGNLAKYPNPPAGPMTMASGSPAFLADPMASRMAIRSPQPQ
jgi:hypothetical protein